MSKVIDIKCIVVKINMSNSFDTGGAVEKQNQRNTKKAGADAGATRQGVRSCQTDDQLH